MGKLGTPMSMPGSQSPNHASRHHKRHGRDQQGSNRMQCRDIDKAAPDEQPPHVEPLQSRRPQSPQIATRHRVRNPAGRKTFSTPRWTKANFHVHRGAGRLKEGRWRSLGDGGLRFRH